MGPMPQDASAQSAASAIGGIRAHVFAVVLLLPPFENYVSTTRISGTWFDGFYFALGDKLQRRFYVPLLYIEVLWVLINGAALWLLFREPPRPMMFAVRTTPRIVRLYFTAGMPAAAAFSIEVISAFENGAKPELAVPLSASANSVRSASSMMSLAS